MKLILASLFTVMLFVSCSSQKPGLQVKKEDMWPWIARWNGELIYKDSAGRLINTTASVNFAITLDENIFVAKNTSSGEYKYPASNDTLTVTKSGLIKGYSLVDIFRKQSPNAFAFVLEKQGIHNGKKATFRFRYDFQNNHVVIDKRVRLAGEEEFNFITIFKGDRVGF